MCGIVGFINKEEKKEKIIKKMADRIVHRGPDAEGFYIDENIALGHRRLAIIDINAGIQPMFNEDEKIVVIFNGEIYNYIELKAELKKKKHKFSTNSDTEVLVHGYEEWGSDLPSKLRGMFAFAIWDKEKETLFCARDHFGIKPLYYYKTEEEFLFASEIKSFLDYPNFKKELNQEILASYLSFSFTPTSETFFKNVYRLDPGTSLTFHKNKLKMNKFFKLEFKEKKQEFEKAVEEIGSIMKDSVNHHLLSDVEIGSFLSSGIDSSYLVALAKPDKTYTVGYDNPKYNEIEYAKNLTELLNLSNTSKKIIKEEYLAIIPKIMYHMDEPSSDPAAVALYFVSNLASQDVKVVLSGEGADEFFGGYNIYRKDVDMSFYNKIPFCIRHLIAKIASCLPEVKGINFLIRRGMTLEENYIGVNKVFGKNEIRKILKVKNQKSNQAITKPVYDEQKNKSDIVKMQAIDINFWLIKDILQKADRMTMANSLEGRVPFIDTEVFHVASSLPIEYKVTKENTKVALREAAKQVIPNESYKKKKLGFPVPLRDWLKENDFYEEVKNTFNKEYANVFFNQKRIIKLLENHKNNKKDNYKKVWTIYCFLKWYEIFFIEN
ncbi:MAG: asparagine synthase (glutamine-hydrolyzing) [Bacilli bacterium]|nr:asparagine synthase (glutamine-hydrolyzing) [Bacilli bacterium]